MANAQSTAREEPLSERRARVERRLAQQREELATSWRALEQRAYDTERRVVGFTRGFRAVLPLGALAGGVWLLRRYGPARLARPATLALSTWSLVRNAMPLRRSPYDKERHGHAASWLPIAITLLNVFRKRAESHHRREDAARTRTAPYRRGRRDAGLRRQP